jgi:tetratricopeptide (TPR) repeat protein
MPPPTAAPAATARCTPWIDGPLRDVAFYVGTPLLLLPLVLLRSGRPRMDEWIVVAGGVAALGHHLPGMMRAYGDRALFARFRWRFVLAPLLLVPVCVAFSVLNLGGVLLVTFFWTTWHTLMQLFGFARIYDAKVGATSRWTSRLDLALCVAWIGAPILASDSRLDRLLELWYGSGGPLLPAAFLGGLRVAWRLATLGVTLIWLAHAARAWRAGTRPSPVKLALFGASFAFWWLCMAAIDNLLVGIALFDLFHDAQYLALVWTFNRARAASDAGIGAFARFLFRGRLLLVVLYLALVGAYGSLGYWSDRIPEEGVRRAFVGVLAASALLHFYFDGFIWKVRERSIRSGLGVAGGGADIRLGGRLPGWAVHGLKWLGFLAPLALLAAWDVADERPERVWRAAVVEAVPQSAEALTALGAALDVRAEPERVLDLHARAIGEKPGYPVSYNNLGVALTLLGRNAEAEQLFRAALERLPDFSIAHRHLASLLVTRGADAEAAEHFRAALDRDPRDGSALAGLALLAGHAGDAREARRLYERALELNPRERTALNGLAWLLATEPDAALRDGARAVTLAERLVELGGRSDPLVLDTLAAAYAEAGRIEDALATLYEARPLAEAAGESEIEAALERHRHRYETGEAWRGAR